MALNTYDSSDARYNGDDFPSLGIKRGDSLNSVLSSVATALTAIKDYQFSPTVKGFEDTISEVAKMAREIDTDKILHGGIVGSDVISADAAKLGSSKVGYGLEKYDNHAVLDVDLKDLKQSLPEGYAVVRQKISIAAAADSNGRTELTSTKSDSLNIDVPYNRFPVSANVSITVSSPNGDIELTKSIPVTGNQSVKSASQLNISDNTNKQNGQLNAKDVINEMASKINSLEKIVFAAK